MQVDLALPVTETSTCKSEHRLDWGNEGMQVMYIHIISFF